MPVHIIKYTLDSDGHAINHEIEWVSPTGWTTEQSISRFESRYRGVAVKEFTEVAIDEEPPN